MSEDDLLALAGFGLDRDEIWDVVEIAAMYNFTNRMALALGQQPNEEYHYRDRPQPGGSGDPGNDVADAGRAEPDGQSQAQRGHTAS
jgi:hypothetical protein